MYIYTQIRSISATSHRLLYFLSREKYRFQPFTNWFGNRGSLGTTVGVDSNALQHTMLSVCRTKLIYAEGTPEQERAATQATDAENCPGENRNAPNRHAKLLLTWITAVKQRTCNVGRFFVSRLITTAQGRRIQLVVIFVDVKNSCAIHCISTAGSTTKPMLTVQHPRESQKKIETPVSISISILNINTKYSLRGTWIVSLLLSAAARVSGLRGIRYDLELKRRRE